MANIGATTAFYKVETSLTRANQEVSKSMERLATGKQNANAGDRSSYVAMSDTFRLDYVGTKAAIKSASVALGYLETGMRVLDRASALLSRLQELAVLGANNTNTTQDHEAINLEAEALADEFNRLMTTSTYKGKNVFVSVAGDQEIAMGGRGAEMTFGIGEVSYTEIYSSTTRTQVGTSLPNTGVAFNLAHLPSDAVVAKEYGAAASTVTPAIGTAGTLGDGKSYIARIATGSTNTGYEIDLDDATNDPSVGSFNVAMEAGTLAITTAAGADVANTAELAAGNKLVASADITVNAVTDEDTGNAGANDTILGVTFAEIRSDDNAFISGQKYVIQSLGTTNSTGTIDGSELKTDADYIAAAATAEDGTALTGTLSVGQTILIKEVGTGAGQVKQEVLDGLNALTEGMTFTRPTETLTVDIEAIQAKINTARVQAGSQYAALESAVEYTTDLTAQYELGFNTVNDVNFSAETAHLAKNQILQQAATAMLAQANSGQQGLLQLIQG